MRTMKARLLVRREEDTQKKRTDGLVMCARI